MRRCQILASFEEIDSYWYKLKNRQFNLARIQNAMNNSLRNYLGLEVLKSRGFSCFTSPTSYFRLIGLHQPNGNGNSHDLNIIENVWADIARSLSTRRLPRREEQLWVNMQEACASTSLHFIQQLFLILPNRLNAVVKSRGGAYKY